MVSRLWIIATMGIVALADNIIGLNEQSTNKWKNDLFANGKLLRAVPIRR